VVKRAVRADTPNPDFELKQYVKILVAEALKNHRLRPPVQRRAASVPERARQIGVGESTLEGEIRAGRLEAFKVKRRTLISDEAFDRWLATCERIKPKRPPASQHEPETLQLV
jgi:excisionase family DNA binding protein